MATIYEQELTKAQDQLAKQYGAAQTAEQRALIGTTQNQLSQGYNGYQSAYADRIGQQIDKIGGTNPYSYGQQTAYQQALDDVLNQPEFTWNKDEDPNYAAYRKMYLREGDRAAASTLAKAAAQTGGVPSSYAVSAANQANNYYAAQLADRVPTLWQMALEQYNDAYGKKKDRLNALEGDRSFDYGTYLDQLQQDQNYLSALQKQDSFDYSAYLDQVQREMQEDQIRREQQQQSFANALALYQALGYATPEIAATLGIPAGSRLYTGSSGGSRSSGSRSSGGSSGSGAEETLESRGPWFQTLRDAAYRAQNTSAGTPDALVYGRGGNGEPDKGFLYAYQNGLITADDYAELVRMFGEMNNQETYLKDAGLA